MASDGAKTTTPVAAQPAMASVVDKWLLWRLTALAFWIWFFAVIIATASGESLPAPWAWFWVGPVAFLGVKWATGRNLAILGYVFYFALFPLVAFLYLVLRMARRDRGPVLLFRRATSWVMLAVSLLGASIIIPALLLATDPGRVVWLAVAQIICVYLVILNGLRWALDPVHPIMLFIKVLKFTQTQIEKGIRDAALPNAAARNWAADIDFMNHIKTHFGPWAEGAEAKAKRFLAILFVSTFFFLLSAAVLGYSASYYALAKTDPGRFENLESRFQCSFVYSVSVITTAPLPNIVPHGDFAQFVYMSETFCAVLLLTAFIAMFSSALSGHGAIQVGDAIAEVRRFVDWSGEMTVFVNSTMLAKGTPPPAPPR